MKTEIRGRVSAKQRPADRARIGGRIHSARRAGSIFQRQDGYGWRYIPQGQLQPGGNLVDPEQIKGEGRILVAIEPEDDLSKYLIVPGSTAQVAVYTHHMHHLAIMRKVLLRMKSWTNFIFGDGH